MRKFNVRDETRTFLLLALAIFMVEFFIMTTLEIAPLSLGSYYRTFLDASILVLLISPLLIWPKKKVTDTKNRLKRILEEIGYGLMVIDEDYNLLMTNSALKKSLGDLTQDTMGMKCYEVIPKDFCSTQNCKMRRILSGENIIVDEKFRDGYWIQDVTTPYRDAEGSTQGIIKTFRDVTDQKNKENRIERLNNILKSIRNVNELIIRESDVEKMLSESCTILREVGEYFHVAIAVCEHTVEKVAESGQGGYFEVGEEIPLCVKKIIGSERIEENPIIFDDTKKHCGKCPYHKEEKRYSAALIPFNTRKGLKLLAVFADINHFDSEEVELLREIADDIGFAIDKHTTEEEHRLIEKEKEEQQKLLQAIINSTPDFVVFKDRGLVYKMVNRAFCQFVGKDREEIVGKTDYDIFPADEAEMYSRDDLYLMETGQTQVQDEEVTGVGGKLWLQVAKTSVYNHKGDTIGLLCSVRDVSERKKFEKALRESEQKYRTTFEHTGTAMMVLEEDGSISLVNEEFERLTGYKKEEVENKMSWKDLIHPDDLSTMAIKEYSSSHLRVRRKKCEFRIIDMKGEVRTVFFAIGNIPESHKSVASLMDITDFKKLNKLLKAYSEINELVAKEKNPEVVLKSVCEKLSLFYNFVFTSLRRDGELIPVESVGIDFDSMNRVVNSCPSVSKAMNGQIMKMRANNKLCRQCTAEPHRYALSIPLIHDKNRGVITVHSNSDFSKDEIELLEKLSSNIAFALSAYEVENDRRAAMEQLTQNLAQFDRSADRLRNPLAVILNSLELVEEIGSDNVLELVREHSIRIKEELDEMREEEIKTYELTTESIKEI